MEGNEEARRRAQGAAVRWARALLDADDWVVLDTETTGTDVETAEIVEVAILDRAGNALVDTLVRPPTPIPPAAARVHGITDADVAGAPALAEVWGDVCAALAGRRAVAYNAAFDGGVLRHSGRRHGLPVPALRCVCAMQMYARLRAEPDARRGGFRLHRLEDACRHHGIDAGGHRAAGDCRATLALIRAAAALDLPQATLAPEEQGAAAAVGDTGGRARGPLHEVAAEILRAARELVGRLTRANAREWEALGAGRAGRRQGSRPDFTRMATLQHAFDLGRDVLYFLEHPGTRACDACRGPAARACLLCRAPLCETWDCRRRGVETWDGDRVCRRCEGEAARHGLLARDAG